MLSPLTLLQKLFSWYTKQKPVELWLDLLRNAQTFEEWEEAALHLDNLLGLDLWYASEAFTLVVRRRASLTRN
jgi:TAG lipase/lysophosphatidylethanolamine acyltransferase